MDTYGRNEVSDADCAFNALEDRVREDRVRAIRERMVRLAPTPEEEDLASHEALLDVLEEAAKAVYGEQGPVQLGELFNGNTAVANVIWAEVDRRYEEVKLEEERLETLWDRDAYCRVTTIDELARAAGIDLEQRHKKACR